MLSFNVTYLGKLWKIIVVFGEVFSVLSAINVFLFSLLSDHNELVICFWFSIRYTHFHLNFIKMCFHVYLSFIVFCRTQKSFRSRLFSIEKSFSSDVKLHNYRALKNELCFNFFDLRHQKMVYVALV